MTNQPFTPDTTGLKDTSGSVLTYELRQRCLESLRELPSRETCKPSTSAAALRLASTFVFSVLAVHALTIAPAWAVPICWLLTAGAFVFVFEIGFDCSLNQFFPSDFLNKTFAAISLLPLLQPAVAWTRTPSAPPTALAEPQEPTVETASRDAAPETEADATTPAQPAQTSTPIRNRKKAKQQRRRHASRSDSNMVEGDAISEDMSVPTSWYRRAYAFAWAHQRVHATHLLVIAFFAVFVSTLIYYQGVWGFAKYWGVPFLLFNVWMAPLFTHSTSVLADLTPTAEPESSGEDVEADLAHPGSSTFVAYLQWLHPSSLSQWAWGLFRDIRLRSYLRFQLHIPSYRLTPAMAIIKKTWSRLFLDGSDGPLPPITPVMREPSPSAAATDESAPPPTATLAQQYNIKHRPHDQIALGAFKTGMAQLRIADGCLSLCVKLVVVVWLYIFLFHYPLPLADTLNTLKQLDHRITDGAISERISPSLHSLNATADQHSFLQDEVMTRFHWYHLQIQALVSSLQEEPHLLAKASQWWPTSITKPILSSCEQFFVTSEYAFLHSVLTAGACIGVLLWIITRLAAPRKVFLVDFVTYTPPESCALTLEHFKRIQREFSFSEEALRFMDRLVERTGLGEKTYFPPGTLSSPPDLSLRRAREEAEMVMFGCLDQLFTTTGVHPRDVDVLVVNCSLFNPTPSLTAMIVNKYKMREDIQSYNLAGMGCSAGVISVHLAKDLLQCHPNSTAVVLSTENITMNWYKGNERGMLISNTLFRMGGAAILLSNKPSDKSRSKYQLLHTVRTHRGADEESYQAVFQDMDESGCVGVRLSKGLMRVAGEALKRNITTLGPLILPWTEQLKYFACNMVLRRLGRLLGRAPGKPYVPNFKKAVTHFCIHAGGRAVVDAIEESLRLSPEDVEASKETLRRYGNTSSSSIWYELAHLEKSGRVGRHERVWQIAFGSGFKCNSAIWEAL